MSLQYKLLIYKLVCGHWIGTLLAFQRPIFENLYLFQDHSRKLYLTFFVSARYYQLQTWILTRLIPSMAKMVNPKLSGNLSQLPISFRSVIGGRSFTLVYKIIPNDTNVAIFANVDIGAMCFKWRISAVAQTTNVMNTIIRCNLRWISYVFKSWAEKKSKNYHEEFFRYCFIVVGLGTDVLGRFWQEKKIRAATS